jgi:hypothetical protein
VSKNTVGKSNVEETRETLEQSPFNSPNLFRKHRTLSESHIYVRIRVNLVGSVPVGYLYCYVIVDGVCKYY